MFTSDAAATNGPDAIYDLRAVADEFGSTVVERLLDYGEGCWFHEAASAGEWRTCRIPATVAARIIARRFPPAVTRDDAPIPRAPASPGFWTDSRAG